MKHRIKQKALLLTVIFASVFFSGCPIYPAYDFAPLEFPFAEPEDITYLAAFGIPDWSGPGHPHDGIDLKVTQASQIISPVHGTVDDVYWNTTGTMSTPPDLVMVHVSIYINPEWQLKLVFEPSGTQSDILDDQLDAISVEKGDEVFPGDDIGMLVAGTEGYTHLHFMVMHQHEAVCAYENSSPESQAIFDDIAEIPGNNMPAGTICGD